jgi:branched-subunit amino acid ABC-type transport system permease component
MFDSTIIVQILWTSVASSSFQVLFTVAFAFVLKITKIWNFTQPGIMGIAFYTMYTCASLLEMPLALAVLAALLTTTVTAYGIEKFGFVTLRRRKSEPIVFFIFTFVFAQLVIFILTLIFTTEPTFMLPSVMSPIHMVGEIIISNWDIEAIVVTLALILILYLFMHHTRPGQFMIAVSDNAKLAEIYGISKNRAYQLSMIIAAIFITAAMYLFGGKLALYPELTLHVMLFAIAATILGGIGNVFGAAGAAIVISVMQQFSVLFVASRWQPLVVFAVLFIAIVLFPNGVRLPRRAKIDARPGGQSLNGDEPLAKAGVGHETSVATGSTVIEP